VLKDAPILLLDEPTEGLDRATASSLMGAINGHLMANRSVLLISHRPEGLEDMDEILVLEKGRVVARGNHGRLLQSLPGYRRLWERLDETTPGMSSQSASSPST
jgi:ABC-type transport system involved in cytochrome bd biosynthesis fused ATPase/permease subunit